jgi:hypothetical protein
VGPRAGLEAAEKRKSFAALGNPTPAVESFARHADRVIYFISLFYLFYFFCLFFPL